MIEYWAALGLACIDRAFREELQAQSKSKNLQALHDTLLEKYHFSVESPGGRRNRPYFPSRRGNGHF